MVKATIQLKDGRTGILLGLSDGNLVRLKTGQPIYIDLDSVKLPEGAPVGAIALFYGPTEGALVAELKDLIGPNTDVRVLATPGDGRPM